MRGWCCGGSTARSRRHRAGRERFRIRVHDPQSPHACIYPDIARARPGRPLDLRAPVCILFSKYAVFAIWLQKVRLYRRVGDNVISYLEMCRREDLSLQKGMNFGVGKGYSIILMSVRANAPYNDELRDDGTTLIYEGHDVPRAKNVTDPKALDQPERTLGGSLTENGKFHEAAQLTKLGRRFPEVVRVYEKILAGIWSYNGLFQLVDSWREDDHRRSVFKFKLVAVVDESVDTVRRETKLVRRRVIPTAVKREVYDRDKGQCVMCGATDQLHFDHDLPFSKGGTSLTAANVQLLCARHNLTKGDTIL